MIEAYSKYLTERLQNNTYREDKNIISDEYINLSTNDYLGLSKHPEMIKTACQIAEKFGVGSGASRLLIPNTKIYQDLEQKIAEWKQKESALFFATGYQLNTTVLPSLLCSKTLKTKPIVFGDRLNHASLNNGILLSNASHIRYKNNDLEHLEWLLKKYNTAPAKFIVTESIFGMDGTLINIEKLISLAKNYKSFLYIDEAHASGVFGKSGNGVSDGFAKEIDCIIGTFSKGMGCQGAYVATSKTIRNYLYNHCAGTVYSTASNPIAIGLADKSIDLVKHMNLEREKLIKEAEILKKYFAKLGYKITGANTHIFSIILGTPRLANDLANKLLNEKILVSAIRYPSVPLHTDRIRISLNINIILSDILSLKILKVTNI